MSKEIPNFIELKTRTSKQWHSKETRVSHCSAWRNSGMSMSKYCEKNNISLTNLSNWLKKYPQEKEAMIPTFTVMPTTKKQGLEVILSSGLKLKFEEISDSKLLIELIQSLSLCN